VYVLAEDLHSTGILGLRQIVSPRSCFNPVFPAFCISNVASQFARSSHAETGELYWATLAKSGSGQRYMVESMSSDCISRHDRAGEMGFNFIFVSFAQNCHLEPMLRDLLVEVMSVFTYDRFHFVMKVDRRSNECIRLFMMPSVPLETLASSLLRLVDHSAISWTDRRTTWCSEIDFEPALPQCLGSNPKSVQSEDSCIHRPRPDSVHHLTLWNQKNRWCNFKTFRVWLTISMVVMKMIASWRH
jgi:hypothetical protein